VETDVSAVMEWAWKLKSERSAELVVSFGTSPVIEDRISCGLQHKMKEHARDITVSGKEGLSVTNMSVIEKTADR
jgi:hypothetical protein